MERAASEAVGLASARHGRLRRSRGGANIGKILLTAFIVLVVSGVSVGAYAAWGLLGNLDTVALGPSGDTDDGQPKVGAAAESVDGELTILLVGSDSRQGQSLNDGEEGELNDVNLLLHVSADHQNATVISFPRDLKVPIPSCPDGQGGYYSAMSEQMLNSALQYGGLPCVALTIANLTGMDIPYAAMITFDGVIAMSNAIGGVTVCLAAPIDDSAYTGLVLPEGENTLQGYDALQFLRTRHGVGNGGDTSRINNQQVFMSAMVRQLKDSGALGNPLTVYSLAKAGVENMQLSDNMATVNFMQSAASTVKDIDLNRINFVQYPSDPHPYEAGRLTPNKELAQELIDLVVSGQPFVVESLGEGVVDPNAAPEEPDETESPEAPADPGTETPGETETDPDPSGPVKLPEGITGQSGADQTCSAGRTVY